MARELIEERCRDALREHSTWLVTRSRAKSRWRSKAEMTEWVREAVEEELRGAAWRRASRARSIAATGSSRRGRLPESGVNLRVRRHRHRAPHADAAFHDLARELRVRALDIRRISRATLLNDGPIERARHRVATHAVAALREATASRFRPARLLRRTRPISERSPRKWPLDGLIECIRSPSMHAHA